MPVSFDRSLARAWPVIAALATVPPLALAAVLNGFPLIYPDTAGYIYDGARLTTDLPRAMGYAVLLKPFVWLGSLWAVIAFQAALSLCVLRLSATAFGCPLDPLVAFGLCAGLAVFSTLPWTVSWVMPDIFAGLVVAGVSAIVAGTLAGPRARLGSLVGLTGLGAAMHSTTIPLVILLAIAGIALAGWQALSRPPQRAIARTLVLRLSIVAGLAAGSSMTLNLIAHGTPRLLPPWGTSFVLARFAATGLLQNHLERHCGSIDYKLCGYRRDLPSDAETFLWDESGPFTRLGSFRALEEEAQRLVAAIVRENPWTVVRSTLVNTVEQLIRFEPGGDMRYASFNPYVLPVLEQFGIQDLDAYKAALQHDPRFPPATVHVLHVAGLVASIVVLAVLLALGRLTAAQRAGLAFVLLGLALNAAICGGLSGPTDRYNSRVVWLLPFFAAVLSLQAARGTAVDDEDVD